LDQVGKAERRFDLPWLSITAQQARIQRSLRTQVTWFERSVVTVEVEVEETTSAPHVRSVPQDLALVNLLQHKVASEPVVVVQGVLVAG
jgi:hypothetical protein